MVTAKFKNSREDSTRAKQLRKTASLPEQIVWNALSKLKQQSGWKFRRQQPLHPYIVDFACMPMRLAIELDGMSHDMQLGYDAKRTNYLNKMGWTVLRFTNQEVLQNLDGVVLTILAKIAELQDGG